MATFSEPPKWYTTGRVRSDISSRCPSSSFIERVRIARDGYLLTVRPDVGGQLTSKRLHQYGYDVAAGPYADRPGMNREIWVGTVDEATPNLNEIENYAAGDELLFAQTELVAVEYDRRHDADESIQADQYEIHQDFREYRRRNSLPG